MTTAEAIVAPANTVGGTLDTALDAARAGAPGQLPVTSPTALSYFAAHPRRPQVYFGDYLLLQTLGEGEFGKVKLGVHRAYGEEVAIKLIKREKVAAAEEHDAEASKISKVEREIQELRHPNIVHLYEVIESERYIGIVLEYGAGGELFDYILAHKCLKERDACRLFAQLISGVSYLHRKKIIHRDLKLENLLLDRDRNVIITDFGFANNFSARENDLMATSCGSPCYAAPELVVQDGMYVGAAVDVWSCGVILYAMLAGYLPFDDDPANPDGDNINLLYKYIMATPLTFPDYIGPEPRSLLLRMLVPDPAHRATLDEVMAHPWLAPYRDLFRYSVQDLERAAIEQQAKKRQVYREQMLYQQKLLERQLAERSATLPRSATDTFASPSTTPSATPTMPVSASLGAVPTAAAAAHETPRDSAPSTPLPTSAAATPSKPTPTKATPTKATPTKPVAVSAAGARRVSEPVPAPARVEPAELEATEPAATAAKPAADAEAAAAPKPAVAEPPKRKAAAEPTEQPSKVLAADEPRAESRTSRASSEIKARKLSNGLGATELNLAALGNAARRTVSSMSRRSASNSEPVSRSSSSGSKRNMRLWPLSQARVEALDKSEDRAQGSRASHSSTQPSPGASETPVDTAAPELPLAAPETERAAPQSTSPLMTPPPVAAPEMDDEARAEAYAHSPEASLASLVPTAAAPVAPAAEPTPSTPHTGVEAAAPPTPAKVEAAHPAAPEPALDYTNRHGLAPPLLFSAALPSMLSPAPAPTPAPAPAPAERPAPPRESVLTSFGQAPLSLTSILPQRMNGESARPRKASVATSRAESDVSAEPVRSPEVPASVAAPAPAAPLEPVAPPAPAAAPPTTEPPSGAAKPNASSAMREPTSDEMTSTSKRRASLVPPAAPRPKPERPRPLSMQATAPTDAPSLSPAVVPTAPGRISLDTTLERPTSALQTAYARTPSARPAPEERPAKRPMSWWRRLSGSHTGSHTSPRPATAPAPAPATAAPAPATNVAPAPVAAPVPPAPLTAVPEEARARRVAPTRKPAPVLRPEPATAPVPSERRPSVQIVDARAPEQDVRRISVAGDARTVQPRPMRMELDDRRLAVHVGAVDQAALTTRPPEEVMRDLFEALFSMGVEMRRARDAEFRIECVRPKRPSVLRQLFSRKRDRDEHGGRWPSRLGRHRAPSAAGAPRASFQQEDVDRAMSRMSIGGLPPSGTGLSRLSLDEPYIAPPSSPLYGDGTRDGGHEVRFYVELTRIPTLHGLYSVDIRRIKGNLWSYKFVYHALLERVELGGSIAAPRR